MKVKREWHSWIVNLKRVYTYIGNPDDRVVNRVIFIDSRFGRHDSANLIGSGPNGQIHFWNIYKNGVLMAKFRPVNISNEIKTPINK